jgi:hypothetical protein
MTTKSNSKAPKPLKAGFLVTAAALVVASGCGSSRPASTSEVDALVNCVKKSEGTSGEYEVVNDSFCDTDQPSSGGGSVYPYWIFYGHSTPYYPGARITSAQYTAATGNGGGVVNASDKAAVTAAKNATASKGNLAPGKTAGPKASPAATKSGGKVAASNAGKAGGVGSTGGAGSSTGGGKSSGGGGKGGGG